MAATAICTIIAKNYLAHARCLTESFLAQHPDGRVFVLLADRIDGYFDPAAESFTTIEAHDLPIPNFEQMAFRYTVVEFNTAVKPFLLEYLFERYDLPSLAYFDPDIYFYQPLTLLEQRLADHDIALTPHLLDVLDDDRLPDEPYILRAGVYNLGFIGLSRGPEVDKLLRWWQQKLLKDCVVDPSRGLFVDQRWIDLVPGLFERVAILRDPGYNAAYWNLKHRRISCDQGRWMANDGPLTFFHFSGLPADDIDAISRHQNRYTLADRPELRPLLADYRDRLLANGYETARRWPYAYGSFDNGVGIPDAARHLWRNLDDGARWPQPFRSAGPGSFIDWLNQEVRDARQQPALASNLALEIYRQRWDIQQMFPDVLGVHRARYASWFTTVAESQYALAPLFIQPVRERLAASAAAARPAPSAPRRGIGPWIYRAARAALRRSGLRGPLRRLVGERRVEGVYAALVQPRRRNPADQPLPGEPVWKRRMYYLARNPLRWMGLHEQAKRLLGRRTVERIHQEMTQPPAAPVPEALRVRSPVAVARQMIALAPNAAPDAAPAAPPAPGLNVVGYLCAETGVGEVARAVLRALSGAGYPVAQTDLSNAAWARSEDRSVLHLPSGSSYRCNLLCVNADMAPATLQRLGAQFLAGKYTIGFWHWETSNFPPRWHDRFACFDEIWVASSFTQKALAAVAPIPVVNVQTPVNALQPSSLSRRDLGLPEDRFVFLFSFDMQSFIQRKNPHGLIEAYRRAFGPGFGATALALKVTNMAAFPREAERLRADLAGVSGVLLDQYMDRAALSGLFAACDAYVSLHRSEGFGLTLAEAMALGKPVIATGYSGNMEFMTPANSYPVGYRVVEIDADYGPYQRGDQWADPDLDHAAELMRAVAADPARAAERGARAADDMRRFFSSEAVARQMIARLDQIERQPLAHPAPPAPPSDPVREQSRAVG